MSVAGYTIGEYVFYILLVYVLTVLAGTIWTYLRIQQQKNWYTPIIMTMTTLTLTYAISLLPIRIGTIFFINGILATMIVLGTKQLYEEFNKEQEEQENYQQNYYEEQYYG